MTSLKKISKESLAVGVMYVSMALILAAKQCVILKCYSLSVWPDLTYYLSSGLRPGVLLPVLGSMLSAFCKFPLFAALLILLSLFGISSVMKKIIGETLWAHLPSVFLFLFLSGLDYSIYAMRSPGFLFSQILGITCSVLILWGAEAIRDRNLPVRILYAISAVIIGYPLTGAFAVAALAAMTVKALKERDWVYAAFCLTSGFIIPVIYASAVFTHIDTSYTFLSGFPYMDFLDNYARFVPLGLAVISVVILPSVSSLLKRFPGENAFSQSVFTAAAVAALVLFSYKDRNFHIELSMEQSLEKHNWNRTLQLASKAENPTRVIVMYRNIALMRTGLLCDRMFTYSNESVPLNTGSQFVSQSAVCAASVFFYNGMLNFSARWAWEMSMIWQRSIERYKYLTLVALFKGDDQRTLIEKYLEVLDRNPFEKKWVAEHRRYLDNPVLLNENEDYRYAKLLSDYPETKFASSAIVESSLIAHYMSQEYPDGVMLHLCLATAMMMKDINSFWYYFERLRAEGGQIPVHVGEAALLFATMSGNQKTLDAAVRCLGGARSPIVQRFSAFHRDASNVKDPDKEKENFKKKYGRTYWYYCYYVKDAVTN